MNINYSKFALLFPGQGSQYIGMCRDLIHHYPIAGNIFNEANAILNFDLRRLVLEGDIEALTLSENAQPAVLTASYASYCVFMQLVKQNPLCAMGHSLGEISALIASGAVEFAEALVYVQKRARIMQQAVDQHKGGSAVVTDLSGSVLIGLIDAISVDDVIVTISGYNSPNQFVVAGTNAGLFQLSKEISKAGGEFIPFKLIPMKVNAPYHCVLMTFAKESIENVLRKLTISKPSFDVWSTVTCKKLSSAELIYSALCEQLVEPVHWGQALANLVQEDVDFLIDIGPGLVIRNLVKENPKLPSVLAFDDLNEREDIFSRVRG